MINTIEIKKEHVVIFTETQNEFLRNLKFEFQNRSNALAFSRGINEYNRPSWGEMHKIEERQAKNYLNRGAYIANVLRFMKIQPAKTKLMSINFKE